MNKGKTLFAQLMEFVRRTSFARIVQKHRCDWRVRGANCTEQLRVMAIAQLTWRQNLCATEVPLNAKANKVCGISLRSAAHRTAPR